MIKHEKIPEKKCIPEIKIEIQWTFLSKFLEVASGIITVVDGTDFTKHIPLEKYSITIKRNSTAIKTKEIYHKDGINYFQLLEERIKDISLAYFYGLLENNYIYSWVEPENVISKIKSFKQKKRKYDFLGGIVNQYEDRLRERCRTLQSEPIRKKSNS